MVSWSELATSCRACLKQSFESYFEMNQECHFSSDRQQFSKIFSFCTHIEVKPNDELPQRICLLCVHDLQKTYEFLQKVLISNKTLNDLKECSNLNERLFVNEPEIDPLENISESEDNIETKIFLEDTINGEVGLSYNSVDNFNTTASTQDATAFLHSNNNKSKNGDFLKSVELQIFPQGRLKCNICQKAYFTVVGLNAHMGIHLPKRKGISKAPLCDNKYIKNEKKKSDISNYENSSGNTTNSAKNGSKTKQPRPKKVYPCEVCGKQTISASKLRYHMVMHTGEKDYLCTMCPKAYSTIYGLKHHMRAHTGERPYECKFCGDRFLRPTTLKSHMRRHTGERPYGCNICGKRFIQHSSMATHIKLNHMDKTIPCPYCDKKYARQTDLNTHLLSHSGDKPFSCHICPSRFTRQSNLNKHINHQHNACNTAE